MTLGVDSFSIFHQEPVVFSVNIIPYVYLFCRCSLHREPVMVSSGTDNCIKMWVFDSPDGTARLLRSREGHRAPPRAIRYYGNTTLATMGEGAGECVSNRYFLSGFGCCANPEEG